MIVGNFKGMAEITVHYYQTCKCWSRTPVSLQKYMILCLVECFQLRQH